MAQSCHEFNDSVVAFLWVDGNVVQGLCNNYDFREGDWTMKERKRPTGNSFTKKAAREAYGEKHKVVL